MNSFSSLVRALELREAFTEIARLYKFGEYRNVLLTPDLANKIAYKNRKMRRKGDSELIAVCIDFLSCIPSKKEQTK